MLIRLAIRDVVLIEALDLDFAAGLGALTGETGAGKSILLDALGLALGAARRQRAGAPRCGAGGGDREFRSAASDEVDRRPARRQWAGGRTGRAADRAPHRQGRWRQPRASSTTSRSRPRCCAISARGWSRSTASMTIAGCSTRAGIARCSTPSGGRHDGAGRRACALARGRGGAGDGARRARRRRARSRMARTCGRGTAAPRARAGRGGDARRPNAPRCRRARGSPRTWPAIASISMDRTARWRGLRQAARRLDRVAHEHEALAAALAALDRAVIEAAEAEEALEAAAQAMAFDPAAARAGSRPGCSICAASPASIASSPTNWRALAEELSRTPRRGSRRAVPGSLRWSARCRRRARLMTKAAAQLSAERAEAAMRLDRGGRRRTGAAQARRRALPHRDRAPARGAVERRRARPRRIPDLDQPRRAVRAARQDRVAAASCRASSSRSRCAGRGGRARAR